jgi:hypothetical protein
MVKLCIPFTTSLWTPSRDIKDALGLQGGPFTVHRLDKARHLSELYSMPNLALLANDWFVYPCDNSHTSKDPVEILRT